MTYGLVLKLLNEYKFTISQYKCWKGVTNYITFIAYGLKIIVFLVLKDNFFINSSCFYN